MNRPALPDALRAAAQLLVLVAAVVALVWLLEHFDVPATISPPRD